MPTVEFETTISAGERPQTYALDRAATEIGRHLTTTTTTTIIIIIIKGKTYR
jgi:hypothetical protein